VLFSHGFGTPRSMYTSFVRSLAEAGYLVAALDHPGMGVVAVDGRLVTPYAQPLELAYLSADQRFVLDTLAADPRFAPHLDLERVVMIGHSRGFVSATCANDERIDACVNLNGVPAPAEREAGLAIPLLTVRATRGDNAQAQTAIYEAMRAPAFDVVVEGSHHSSVTDRDLFAAHVRDVAERRQRVINAVVIAFLDQTLRGREGELQRAAKRFAEVTLSVRGR
jgi:pimeloyl-ACP methyl ester carboxylesterase